MAYTYRPATLDEARKIQEAVGSNPPTLREFQFWYNPRGDLLMVLTVPENTSDFAAIQCVEIRRGIVELYARSIFARSVYAPMLLDPLE